MAPCLEINYFTCTLGEAVGFNSKNPPPYTTVNSFVDTQAYKNSSRPAVAFPSPDKDVINWECEVLSFQNLRDYSMSAAKELLKHVPEESKTQGDKRKSMALLSYTSVEFILAWLGLMRAGYTVLLISPKCGGAEIKHLCGACNVAVLFHDASSQDVASELKSKSLMPCKIQLLPPRVELLSWVNRPESSFSKNKSLFRNVKTEDIAYYHHTSGTTSGQPKPIPQPHHAAVCALPNLKGEKEATFTTTPLYHGGIADCFRAWTSNAVIVLFPEAKVPISAKNIVSCLQSCRETEYILPSVRYFSSVPYVLQIMSQDEVGMRWLKNMDLVGVGGAALPESVGKSLVDQGVKLVSRFGSAECGFLLSSNRDCESDKAWNYVRTPPNARYIRFEHQKDLSSLHLYELIILPGWPHMPKTNRADGSWATSDLFEPHSTISNSWRYHSRGDAQIALLTGKKFDPAPLEEEICASSKLIAEILVFGSGRQIPGALIFPAAVDGQNRRDEIMEVIWNEIENVNSTTSIHSRLSKEMLVIMEPTSDALPRSSKGTILRTLAEERYRDWIEEAYSEKPQQLDQVTLSDSDISEATRKIVKEAVGSQNELDGTADFFHQGLDSSKCTQIRSKLQRLVVNPLPFNVVYDQGNLESLVKFMLQARDGNMYMDKDDGKLMHELVEKYSQFDTPDTTGSQEQRSKSICGHVVLLTGATGTLGANVLDILRKDATTAKIVCLVRAKSTEEAHFRVSKSLSQRKKEKLSANTQAVVCLASSLAEPDLGLSKEQFSLLKQEITMIIHTAWAVNFAIPLKSFINDHIAGLQTLLRFSASQVSPSRFIFCSSTASILGPNHPKFLPEQVSMNHLDAGTLGYARSKWVAEQICVRANINAKLKGRVVVLRIGQLTGNTQDGVWNMTEAWPLMLSTSLPNVLGCLPALEETIAWLPVDTAAKAVVKIGMSNFDNFDKENIPLYHIASNDRNTDWLNVLSWLQKGRGKDVNFEVVNPIEWIKRLEEFSGDHPAKQLIPLWKAKYSNTDVECNVASDERISTIRKGPVFSTLRADAVCGEEWNVSSVDEALVGKIWWWMLEQIQVQANTGITEK